MQVTPFSARISLCKIFATDRSGSSILPVKTQDDEKIKRIQDENSKLKLSFEKLRSEHVNTLSDLDKAHKYIEELEESVRSQAAVVESLEVSYSKARDSAITLNSMVNVFESQGFWSRRNPKIANYQPEVAN